MMFFVTRILNFFGLALLRDYQQVSYELASCVEMLDTIRAKWDDNRAKMDSLRNEIHIMEKDKKFLITRIVDFSDLLNRKEVELAELRTNSKSE